MSQDIEAFAEQFGMQIRKGFISALILLVLEKQSLHGYGIVKEIEKRTLGMWKYSTSSIYPVLDSLKKLKLINSGEDRNLKRPRIDYFITDVGSQMLKVLIRKYSKLKRAITSITLSTLGLNSEFEMDDIEWIFPHDPVFDLGEKTDEEKIHSLTFEKAVILERMESFREILDNIDEELEKLEKGIKQSPKYKEKT